MKIYLMLFFVIIFIFLYSDISNTENWISTCKQNKVYYGKSISSAGDVNGDGYDDIIVHTYKYTENDKSGGTVLLYYGKE